MDSINNSSVIPQTVQDIPPHQSKKPLYSLLGLILLSAVGIAAYSLGAQSSQKKQTSDAVPTPVVVVSPVVTSEPTVTPPSASALPAGWTYRTNNECDVEFAIPPKEPPYYKTPDPSRPPSVTNDEGSGRFWDFPRGNMFAPMLSKFDNDPETINIKSANTMFVSEQEASGYIAAAVSVKCTPNTKNLNNDSMISILRLKLEEFNRSTGERGMEPSTYFIETASKVSRWGQNVFDLSVKEVYGADSTEPSLYTTEYTIFTTSKFMYEVRITAGTDDVFVRNTAKQIFDLLRFK